ncbi:MAG TPA: 50S ribosomal protein L18, partial [Dysgonamonadaceae bacterium]|nr:50S ribosomal protein L18 [Dysgonamonadaceae bacterium]
MLTREQRRLKIKARVRGKVHGTPDCPRLSVFRSNKQIYAQVIDDTTGRTLASASSLKIEEKLPKKEIAAKVGDLIAKNAKEAGIAFDGRAQRDYR